MKNKKKKLLTLMGCALIMVGSSFMAACDLFGTPSESGTSSESASSSGHDHSYTETITQQASCTETGERTFTCACGDTYTEVIPALGHTDDGTKNEVRQATCEEEGYTVRHCSVCDTDYKTDFVHKKCERTYQ